MSGQKTKTSQLDELSMHGAFHAPNAAVHEPIQSHPPVSEPTPILPHGTDEEGEMAKADLYKIATYSTKLFKKLDNNTQLESWVQAKITKAADYIASVYHYIEYEMEFSEYGKKLDNAEVFNEETRAILKNKLMEAKAKIKELKKLQADKVSKKKETECMKETSEEKKKAYRDAAGKDMQKAAKAGDKATISKRLKGVSKSLKESILDESYEHLIHEIANVLVQKGIHSDGITAPEDVLHGLHGSHRLTALWSQVSEDEQWDLVDHIANLVYDANPGSEFDNEDEGLYEGRKNKPDFLDLDKDGNKKEPMKKAAKEKKLDELSKETLKSYADKRGDQYFTQKKPVGFKELDKYDLGLKKLKKKEKEAEVNEAAPSAGLSAKKKSATVKKAKAGGDIGKKGKGFEKVASKAAEKYGSKEKGEKVAAAAMWKNIKREDQVAEAVKKAKKDYDGDGKIESGKAEYMGSKDKAIKSAKKEKECVKESSDLTRMKEFLTRLNG
jgi:hypothetical protein